LLPEAGMYAASVRRERTLCAARCNADSYRSDHDVRREVTPGIAALRFRRHERRILMKEFLAPTKYCDSADPSIIATMATIRQGRAGREAAVRLFHLVRDEVHYAFGPWGTTASSTLARLQGGCSNKSNLLVALLRAAGIPA